MHDQITHRHAKEIQNACGETHADVNGEGLLVDREDDESKREEDRVYACAVRGVT